MTEKRFRLLAAATLLFHEQGYHRTTLADVADRASVPLGNVYYYFKTKDALAEAVISAEEALLRERFASWTFAHGEPRARLRSFLRATRDSAERVSQYGSFHGSLCQELGKQGAESTLARAAMRLLGIYIDWVEEQFRAHGVARADARNLATSLVAAVQGAMLLANAMHSKEVLSHHLSRVERSLDDTLSTARRGPRPIRKRPAIGPGAQGAALGRGGSST